MVGVELNQVEGHGMTHSNEIKRWADSPDGTEVWIRESDGRWWLTDNPRWIESVKYIVDDERAEYRRALADGKTIQFKRSRIGSFDCGSHWVDWNSYGQQFESGVYYRVKPEVEYPAYFREKSTGIVVKFTGLSSGIVIEGDGGLQSKKGFKWNCFIPHNKSNWWTELSEYEEEKEEVYYYLWEKPHSSDCGESISMSNRFMTDEYALNNGHTVEKGWERVESSKRTKQQK